MRIDVVYFGLLLLSWSATAGTLKENRGYPTDWLKRQDTTSLSDTTGPTGPIGTTSDVVTSTTTAESSVSSPTTVAESTVETTVTPTTLPTTTLVTPTISTPTDVSSTQSLITPTVSTPSGSDTEITPTESSLPAVSPTISGGQQTVAPIVSTDDNVSPSSSAPASPVSNGGGNPTSVQRVTVSQGSGTTGTATILATSRTTIRPSIVSGGKAARDTSPGSATLAGLMLAVLFAM